MIDANTPGDAVLTFLAERHLATLTTLRADGSPHVVAVGFTYSPSERLVRVITFAPSVKARQRRTRWRAAVCQVDGGRWLTLEGVARVTDDPDEVATAVQMYAARYREPGERDDRVAIEIQVDRILGRARNLLALRGHAVVAEDVVELRLLVTLALGEVLEHEHARQAELATRERAGPRGRHRDAPVGHDATTQLFA